MSTTPAPSVSKASSPKQADLGTTPEPGSVFPPRDVWDVAAYDRDEVLAGYFDHQSHDPEPGPNRSPAFRWGWTNRRRDTTHEPDCYEPLRYAYIRMLRRAN